MPCVHVSTRVLMFSFLYVWTYLDSQKLDIIGMNTSESGFRNANKFCPYFVHAKMSVSEETDLFY